MAQTFSNQPESSKAGFAYVLLQVLFAGRSRFPSLPASGLALFFAMAVDLFEQVAKHAYKRERQRGQQHEQRNGAPERTVGR